MANDKVEVIVTDESGKEIPFFTKTLTAEFKNKPAGKKYKIFIQEPGKEKIACGEYTIPGTVTPPPPPPPVHICPTGQHWDEAQQKCVDDTVTPPPPPPPVEGLLYDSNITGKWNEQAGEITDYDHLFPKPFQNGKGLEMHASGNPRLRIEGTGVATLISQPGHGRVYIDSVNYKAVTEYELRFNDTNIDNHTCQTMSRHQEGDPPEHRFGGLSHEIDRAGCGTKIEKYHNVHISGPDAKLPKPIAVGQWVKVRYTDIPNQADKSISVKIEIDTDGSGFVKALEHKFTGLDAYMVDEATMRKISYTWLRVNNTKTGSVSFRNFRQTAL